MKTTGRIMAIFLIVMMLLPYNVMAAEKNSHRQEDLNFLLETLREKHPNIFANTSEEAFMAKKAEIEASLDKSTGLKFALDLQSLVAMVRDSHTSMNLNSFNTELHFFPITMEYYEGEWILSLTEKDHEAYLGQRVVAINNIAIDEIYKRFSKIISSDNDIKLRRQFKQIFYIEEMLDYLDIIDMGASISVAVRDKAGTINEFTVKSISATDEAASNNFVSLAQKRAKVPVTAYDKTKNYASMPLDENTYYIQYNKCQEDKKLPMKIFSQQVKENIDTGKYTKVLLDFRNNGGGSDGVILPLLTMLSNEVRQKNIKLYGLIGEATFSSAIINAAMLKEAGGILVGSLTSGSVDHFGSVNGFTLPHSGYQISYSTKFIRINDYFEAGQGYGVEPLRPDFLVDQTLSGYMAGVDTAVAYLQTNGNNISLPIAMEEGLTRGRAVEMLYEIAKKSGKDLGNNESMFNDTFGFAYYAPAVGWAKENGIIKGIDGKTFAPARLITREELAVILTRFVDYLKVTPQIQRETVSFADEALISTWALDAAQTIYKWGLVDTSSKEFRPKDAMTRTQGKELLQKLIP